MTTKMRRSLLVISLALVAGASAAVWMLYRRTFTVVIPQERIQESLDAKFPISKRHLLVFTVRYSSPVVILEEGSDRLRAGVDAEAQFTVNDVTLAGSAVISGSLAYSRESGEFMLEQARVEKLDIGGLPERYAAKVKDVASMAVPEYLDRKPIYRLRQSDVKHSLAKLVLRQVTVRNQALVVTLGIGP